MVGFASLGVSECWAFYDSEQEIFMLLPRAGVSNKSVSPERSKPGEKILFDVLIVWFDSQQVSKWFGYGTGEC